MNNFDFRVSDRNELIFGEKGFIMAIRADTGRRGPRPIFHVNLDLIIELVLYHSTVTHYFIHHYSNHGLKDFELGAF